VVFEKLGVLLQILVLEPCPNLKIQCNKKYQISLPKRRYFLRRRPRILVDGLCAFYVYKSRFLSLNPVPI
jgi:hypothetical protein